MRAAARPLAAVFLGALLAAASAARAGGVAVTVGSVLATDGGQPEFDPRLVAMKPQFDSLFRYSSYRLMKQERRVLDWGQGASFDIPGGRYLVIAPKELRDSKVSMQVMLLEGGRPLVDTSVALRDHGVLLVGGPKQLEGVLIVAIGADTE
ncbi:MAG: hypothetical protein HY271_08890 [Deltaproteobacteria bacterium]|nr:hypothetical protein [Deltaproteobacteria bacterium]